MTSGSSWFNQSTVKKKLEENVMNLNILCIFVSIKVALIALIFIVTMILFTKEPYPSEIRAKVFIEKIIWNFI